MTTNSPADKSVKILDCTIRDGSYLIDYQFTVEDAYLIASALCQAGIEYIEVGHGLGLDAQWRGKGLAAESDHAYIEASVAATEERSKIGVFFIPGIGDIESIRQAADVGLDFVRVGTNVNEYMQAREAVEVAKQLGLKVWSNLMKSYIVPPDEFARICREVEKYGVDVITVVDSAGGMTPGSVRQYVSAAKSVVNCTLGFHGHNNLQLVMGNSLAAVESGCVFIDASLRGMGRSAGNAATEILCALLIREGVDIGEVNYKKLIRIADELVVPMMPHDRGLLPIEIACGLSHFHSSFLPIVEKSGAEHGVAAFEVILEMNAKTEAFIDKGLADKAAKKAAKSLASTQHKTQPAQARPWVSAQPATVAELWKTLKELSAKTGYKLVLTIARSRNENQKSLRITPVRVGYGYCVGHIESPSAEHDIRIFEQLETIPSLLMVDLSIILPASIADNRTVVYYDDDFLILGAVIDFMRLNYCHKTFHLVMHPGPMKEIAEKSLACYCNAEQNDVDVLIAFSSSCKCTINDIGRIKDGGILLLAQVSSAEHQAIEIARERGLGIYRLDLKDALLCEVARVFGQLDLIRTDAGTKTIDGVDVVAGGFVGKAGSVVVNSITKPTKIYGVADGRGGVRAFNDSEQQARNTVLNWILKDVY